MIARSRVPLSVFVGIRSKTFRASSSLMMGVAPSPDDVAGRLTPSTGLRVVTWFSQSDSKRDERAASFLRIVAGLRPRRMSAWRHVMT